MSTGSNGAAADVDYNVDVDYSSTPRLQLKPIHSGHIREIYFLRPIVSGIQQGVETNKCIKYYRREEGAAGYKN